MSPTTTISLHKAHGIGFHWEFPNLVVLNLVICNFYAEALFCALLRPFALFCALLRTCVFTVATSADPRGETISYFCKFWAVEGLKEFVDHLVSAIGHARYKPTTEFCYTQCCRGIPVYPKGPATQRSYELLTNDFRSIPYSNAVKEANAGLCDRKIW